MPPKSTNKKKKSKYFLVCAVIYFKSNLLKV